MLAHPSLKHIQQRLVTILRFIQRVFGPTIFRKLCTALFRHLILSLRVLRARWQILCEKQWRVNSSFLGLTKLKIDGEYGSTIDADGQSQVSIPLNSLACSLYPSINESHDGSSSITSQTLDTAIFLQSPEIVPPSRDPNIPTSSSSLSHISISVPDEPIYTTQPHFVLSPAADTRRPGHHRIRGYRSDSTESTEQLCSRETSSSHYKTLVADLESSHSSIDLSSELPRQETLISTPTYVDDLETPALSRSRIYPVAPEYFKRHDKRRNIPNQETKVTIMPFCRDFSDYHDIPGWNACTHPEGGRYFHNAEKVLPHIDYKLKKKGFDFYTENIY